MIWSLLSRLSDVVCTSSPWHRSSRCRYLIFKHVYRVEQTTSITTQICVAQGRAPNQNLRLERVEPGPSTRKCVCSTLTYKTYKLRSFKSDHPYLSTLCASILVKIRYNWSILLQFLLVTLIWSVSFEHIRIFLACGSARPSARSISAEVGRPGQRKEPAANSVNTRSTPIQVNSKGLKHLLSKISVKDDLKVEKR